MDTAALYRWLARAAPGCACTDFGNGGAMLHWHDAAPRLPEDAWRAAGWRVVAQVASRSGRQGVWMLRRAGGGLESGAGDCDPDRREGAGSCGAKGRAGVSLRSK